MDLRLSSLLLSLTNNGTSSRALIEWLIAKLLSSVGSLAVILRALPSWFLTRCSAPCKYRTRVVLPLVALALSSKVEPGVLSSSLNCLGACITAQGASKS